MMIEMLPVIEALPVVAQAATEMGHAATAGGGIGNLTLGIAGAGAGLGIGMIGAKAAEAVGRNPGAFGKVLTIGIIAMALAEAIAIYALIIAFRG
jgi:F-type H+-transporting ATPase subunit c